MASRESDQESSTTTAVKDKGQQLASEAQQQVQEKAVELRKEADVRLREQVDRQSTAAGDQIHAVGQALRRSSEQLRNEGKETPAKLVEEAASRTESLGRYLLDADSNRIIGDIETFARRRPWMTGAAGVLAGFLASRFIKASSDRRYQTSRYETSRYLAPGVSPNYERELSSGGTR
jgi:hypothetical protein